MRYVNHVHYFLYLGKCKLFGYLNVVMFYIYINIYAVYFARDIGEWKMSF